MTARNRLFLALGTAAGLVLSEVLQGGTDD